MLREDKSDTALQHLQRVQDTISEFQCFFWQSFSRVWFDAVSFSNRLKLLVCVLPRPSNVPTVYMLYSIYALLNSQSVRRGRHAQLLCGSCV